MTLTQIIESFNSTCNKTKKIWSETKPIRSDDGFLIRTIELTNRSEALRMGIGLALAITPVVGFFGGGKFLSKQYIQIHKRKEYATHPFGEHLIKPHEDELYIGAFLSQVSYHTYLLSYFLN